MRSANFSRYKAIGQAVKKQRVLKGWTQEELANKASISLSYLTKIEAPATDKVFSLEVLFVIADTLEIPVTDLLDDI